MNDQLTPPGERDLPPRRATEMRAALLTAARGPRPRPTRRWLVAMVSATAVVTAVAAVALVHQVRDDDTQILALGPGELSPGLKRGAEQCLKWHAQHSAPPNEAGSGPGNAVPSAGAAPGAGTSPGGTSPGSTSPGATAAAPRPDTNAPAAANVPVSMRDIAVASRQGDTTAILFLNDTGYVGCDLTEASFGREISGGLSAERWPHREWLPGPVQRLSLSSTEVDGGDVSVLGRVSPRVHRLVLERGNGKSTTARLAKGAFGILTTTDDVRRDAELVGYDAAGEEIDRTPLFTPFDRLGRCYTDPAGTVIYGEAGPDCRPADPWRP